jgi:hypothetical protein
MKTINWSGYEWITQERWGDIHPEKTYCWYDEHAVSIDVNSHLHLKTRYNPKWFKDKELWSNTGVGLVSCTNKFKHGTFEIEAKLPNGLNLCLLFGCGLGTLGHQKLMCLKDTQIKIQTT